MKKSKSLLTLLITTISTMGLISITSTVASASYQFDVISDTHIGAYEDPNPNGNFHPNSNLQTTLQCIKKSYPDDQCIVINGDVVDNYKDSSYKKLSEIIQANKTDLPFIYFNIGNHEYASESSPYNVGNYTTGLNTFNSNTNSIQSLLSTRNIVTNDPRRGSYDLQYINGKNDRLVFLGTDEIPVNSSCSANLNNDTQLNWLINTAIKDNTYEGQSKPNGRKPMFIFLHQPVYDTTYGSKIDSWGYLYPDDSSILKNALNGHPEIIMFTGHTHEQFTDSNTDPWNFDNWYSLGDSSATFFNVPSVGEDKGKGPEGYHVTVYSGGVVVTGVKYTNAGVIKINTRTVDF